MIRLLLLATAIRLVTGCGTIDCDDQTYTCVGDDRPATLEYVTETILRPYCATAGCHSAFAFRGNPNTGSHYRFDTVDHARQSILTPNADDPMGVPAVDTVGFDPDSSLLYNVLVRPTGPTGKLPRMPYDEPLQTSEIALIRRWISSPADGGAGLDGLGAP